MSDAPNLPPIADQHWPESAAGMNRGFAGKLNVYRVMAHDPALLKAWAPLREHVVRKTALGPQRSEVVILRTGHRLGSAYEWAHHVSRGRAVGLEEARILSIAGPLEQMTPEDAILAGAVDALFDSHRIDKPLQAELVALVGVEGMFDLIATVGFYFTLGGILQSFDTPIDEDVAAELAARPPGQAG